MTLCANLHMRGHRGKRIDYLELLPVTEIDLKILNETWDLCLESLVKEFYMFIECYVDF